MKVLAYILSLCTILLLSVTDSAAQFSITPRKSRPDTKELINHKDSVKHSSDVSAEFFNLARWKAERAAIRKERNTLEMNLALTGSLSSYNDAWIATSDGDNSIAALATFSLKHNFTKGKFTIDNKVEAKFGYNRMKVEVTQEDGSVTSSGVWFKNQDEFLLSTAPAVKISKTWNFGSIIKFRSQFTNGYVSRTEQERINRKSAFMTPGYFDVSIGFTYNCPKTSFPVKINLSPLAVNATFVENALVRENGYLYGIEDPASTSKWEGGSSIQIDFDKKWGKNGWFRYSTTLYSFSGWLTNLAAENKIRDFDTYKQAYDKWVAEGEIISQKPVLPIHPTVRWENKIELRASKFISTVLNCQLYYNRAQNYDIQLQTLLQVGLSYTFKNK